MAIRRRIWIFLGAPVVLALIVGLAILLNPLWRSEAAIRKSLLRQTPLGSSYEEVHSFVEQRGWLDKNYVGNNGYYYQQAGAPGRVVGSSSLRGDLGDYRVIFRTDVTGYWGFDEDRKLVDIWVWKSTDAL